AQIREILISESAWEEMTCLFAPSLSWSDTENGHRSIIGVLKNIHPKGAAGIGIQVLDQQQQPVKFNTPSYINLAPQDKGNHSIPFYAQYYQTANNVSPGIVRSVLYFNAEYQ
ncbi:fimbrial protein, partial [Citrobacter braakii]|uniref:fimbrial protein n=1 Tax=Citrobacter braakii TaxID=57706 RepID=UPI003983DBA3